jgi:hypothetical protein
MSSSRSIYRVALCAGIATLMFGFLYRMYRASEVSSPGALDPNVSPSEAHQVVPINEGTERWTGQRESLSKEGVAKCLIRVVNAAQEPIDNATIAFSGDRPSARNVDLWKPVGDGVYAGLCSLHPSEQEIHLKVGARGYLGRTVLFHLESLGFAALESGNMLGTAVLEQACRVSGRVIDTNGRPVPHVEVSIVGPVVGADTDLPTVRTLTAGSRGGFCFNGLNGGLFSITGRSLTLPLSGSRMATGSSELDEEEPIDLVLKKRRGQVVISLASREAPLPEGAIVYLVSSDRQVAYRWSPDGMFIADRADGYFELADTPVSPDGTATFLLPRSPGRHTPDSVFALARAAGWASALQLVQLSEEGGECSLELTKRGGVNVRITGPDGHPVPDASVTCHESVPGGGTYSWTFSGDADGLAMSTGVLDPSSLFVDAHGFLGRWHEVTARESQVGKCEIQLERAPTIDGVIICREAPEQVHSAVARLLGSGHSPSIEACPPLNLSARNGVDRLPFSFELPQGEQSPAEGWVVAAEALSSDGVLFFGREAVSPNSTGSVEVELHRGTRVLGSLAGLGLDSTSWAVVAESQDGRKRRAAWLDSGRFLLWAAPGRWTLSVVSIAHAEWTTPKGPSSTAGMNSILLGHVAVSLGEHLDLGSLAEGIEMRVEKVSIQPSLSGLGPWLPRVTSKPGVLSALGVVNRAGSCKFAITSWSRAHQDLGDLDYTLDNPTHQLTIRGSAKRAVGGASATERSKIDLALVDIDHDFSHWTPDEEDEYEVSIVSRSPGGETVEMRRVLKAALPWMNLVIPAGAATLSIEDTASDRRYETEIQVHPAVGDISERSPARVSIQVR